MLFGCGQAASPALTGLLADATATLDSGEALHARYVVAADGLHSTVRRLAGIGFGRDTNAGESFTLADIRSNGGGTEIPLSYEVRVRR